MGALLGGVLTFCCLAFCQWALDATLSVFSRKWQHALDATFLTFSSSSLHVLDAMFWLSPSFNLCRQTTKMYSLPDSNCNLKGVAVWFRRHYWKTCLLLLTPRTDLCKAQNPVRVMLFEVPCLRLHVRFRARRDVYPDWYWLIGYIKVPSHQLTLTLRIGHF